MKHVLLLLAFLITGAISQPVYAYQDKVCYVTTSDSIRLYVHVKGEGPMCLYLHGGPGSGSTWMEAVSGHILEKRFTMVYLDQRGVCKSETPKNDDFSFARQIQDWEEVRQALGIDHWLLMGHSWGGILMMGYWKAHPSVIDGMMFINCTLSRDTSFEESWLPRAISILGDAASPVAKDESRPLKERMMAVFPQLNDDNRWMLFTPNKWANDSIGSWRFHKDCISHGKGETPLFMDEYGEDFRPLTSAIKVPVLYLYGKQDYAVGPDHYKTLHFPNAIVLGADCGHIVFLEKPAVFAEALDKFCQQLLTQISEPEIQILTEIRPEVNYVTHLYTLAELGFSDSTYAAKYGHTLPKVAIDTLQKYKEFLTFVPWSAFESLACWYNCKIAGRKTADYHAFGEADVQTFCQIFDRLSKEGISDPAELYRKGVMDYLSQNCRYNKYIQ